LRFLADSYLFKDLLMLDNIKKLKNWLSLLQAHKADQIGSEVSCNELASLVIIDSKTIEILHRSSGAAFIIFKLPSFGRNLRNELKQSKIYFYDNGIRNALINDCRLLEGRQDVGPLFENFDLREDEVPPATAGILSTPIFGAHANNRK
ncbi:MAG: DUF4143 domain-containing protein, partial [Saprospiraceae bacterium]|nr:DUF4143 domain-containing protein [Saprospiraceae bacterium]